MPLDGFPLNHKRYTRSQVDLLLHQAYQQGYQAGKEAAEKSLNFDNFNRHAELTKHRLQVAHELLTSLRTIIDP